MTDQWPDGLPERLPVALRSAIAFGDYRSGPPHASHQLLFGGCDCHSYTERHLIVVDEYADIAVCVPGCPVCIAQERAEARR